MVVLVFFLVLTVFWLFAVNSLFYYFIMEYAFFTSLSTAFENLASMIILEASIQTYLFNLLAFWAGVLVLTQLAPTDLGSECYCADCGQYLGKEDEKESACPRCGCNIYTTKSTGVGRTFRGR